MASIQTYTGDRIHIQMIAGQNEVVDTDITVTGITAADGIVAVLMLAADFQTGEYRPGQFTVGAGVIDVLAAFRVNTTGQFYLIIWEQANL